MSRDYIGYSSSLDFIELINYKIGTTPGCMSHHALRIVFMQRWTDPWSSVEGPVNAGIDCLLDLGSVNAPPPLDHRDSGVGWSCGPLVLDVMRNRIALGIIPGETYREPQATSSKPHNLWLCG
jgi:hypothetical protein